MTLATLAQSLDIALGDAPQFAHEFGCINAADCQAMNDAIREGDCELHLANIEIQPTRELLAEIAAVSGTKAAA